MKFPKKLYVAVEEDAGGDESLVAFATLAEASEFSGETDRTWGSLAVYRLDHRVDVKTTVTAKRIP